MNGRLLRRSCCCTRAHRHARQSFAACASRAVGRRHSRRAVAAVGVRRHLGRTHRRAQATTARVPPDGGPRGRDAPRLCPGRATSPAARAALAGSVASVAALAEFATQRNLLLEFGLRTWTSGPTSGRNCRCVSGSSGPPVRFGHPIELGVVLGMCLIAALRPPACAPCRPGSRWARDPHVLRTADDDQSRAGPRNARRDRALDAVGATDQRCAGGWRPS